MKELTIKEIIGYTLLVIILVVYGLEIIIGFQIGLILLALSFKVIPPSEARE